MLEGIDKISLSSFKTMIIKSLQCSVSCGKGEQRRRVGCQAVTKEGWILPGEVPYGCRQSERPVETQQCSLGPCQSRYRWITGPWGEVLYFLFNFQ